MHKKIIRRPCQSIDALNVLHPVLNRIYAARRIESIQALDCSFNALQSYESLLGINDAVSCLGEAIRLNQTILIVGDFDADGATSTALAVRALRALGAKQVEYLVPNRFAYGYGLTPELVAVAKNKNPSVIVTVDNGIANHAGVDAAKALGMRVVITDHHLPAAILPLADAIVNPNQPHDPFPSKNLAGVGVIFYVMLALRRYLSQQTWFAERGMALPNMSQFLNLVALGTIADLVPLDQNNRILVQQGLRRIRAGQCIPGIVALLELSGRDFKQASASDLGFAVASRLNAAGRIDDMSLGIECLLSDDAARARDIARELDQLNHERKSIEKEMQVQAFEALNKTTANLKENLPRGICLYDPSWHQGVIGILAARIKDRFNRPAIVFAPGQDNQLKGSARSIPGLHIRDILALIDAQHPQLIIKFGGHAMAAGLTIASDRIHDFSNFFEKVIADRVTEAELEHALLSDGELQATDLNLEMATMLRDGGPWGQAFPEPVFDGTFHVLEQRLVGDKHLKLRLACENKTLDAISFFVDTNKWPNHRCQQVRAVYRLDINEYKGRSNLQLMIDYLEPIH